ncbi:peptide deformylase [Desulfuromusa kysingii]|uniref:Peptide deformylase n=1 Tax=Desulfuromusa kysingii TaxID=37625 RepID=A0A1H3W672_9BACT|nr:peptide deformylase [Desulfuromusa kysingii]SDZ82331.1 peptide deformylase [Desulfuromusa kysingii]
MSVKEVLVYPDSRLKEHCNPIVNFDESVQQLLQNLVDTMVEAGHSVGIAAPQIGDLRRAAVVDVSKSKLGKKQENHGLLQMVNPEITEREGNQVVREGCMSVPDYTGNVTRSESIVVQFVDQNQQFQVVRAEGFEAVAIQHELDHLDGFLFLDRVSSLKTDLFRRKTKKTS